MAITVTPDLTDISLCEAATGWDNGAIDDTVVIQGQYSLAMQVKQTTSPIAKYTFGAPQNMTGKHIYIWMNCAGTVDTQALGGYRIYVETDANNYGTWYVGGKDTHPAGGWICFILDPASTPTDPVGTINPASIAKVGVGFKTLTTIVGQAKNTFWDACRYGTGLTITSGVADAITFEDIFADDDASTKKYGVVQKSSGAYIVQGVLTFGGTGTENVDFVDTSQVILFPDNDFASASFYGIKVLAGTGTVNFTLGEKVGTAGISGCVIKGVGVKTFSFDVADADIDKMQLYGSTLNNAGAVTLPPNAANREVLNCNFESCGQVIANTCVITNCNFVSADADAILISNDPHYVTYCNFINCPNGVELDTLGDGAYDFIGLIFTGTTYHVNNTSGSALIVNNSAGANASTYTGSAVTFPSTVTLKMIVKDESGTVMSGVPVYIDDNDQSPYILNTTTDINGEASTGYSGGAVSNTRWRARKYGYKPFQQLIDIDSADITLPITMVVDPFVL